MKVAMVTMEVHGGRCEENFAYMMKQIQRARADHADLIVFPQDCISGAYWGDSLQNEDYCRYLDQFNERLIQESMDLAIAWGNLRYRSHQRFHCAFFAYQGETYMRVKKKSHSPFFREDSFQELGINRAISLHDEVLALNFGSDIQLADWNINIDARPFDIHEAMELHGNVIYVNAVGMQNEGKAVVMMEGGSAIYREGKCLWQQPYGEAGYALIDTDVNREQAKQPRKLAALLAGAIRGFDQQILGGKCPWIVGLSGGLDSSVSAALLTYALGKDRVIGYGMSSENNSHATKNNARQLASALEIEYHEGSILPLVETTKITLASYGYDQVEGLTLENIQARLRGHLLSSFASLHGGVVVNNGNKVENALGYCTMYGDAIGALGILGDLTKVQLFKLSSELNQIFKKPVIPENLLPQCEHGQIHFEVAPSAELRYDQVDPMKWFYHDYLVDHLGRDLTLHQFLRGYLDGSLMQGELRDIMLFYGLDDPECFLTDLNWFLATAQRNMFKHTQVPAILTVSRNGYALRHEIQGFDERESLQELMAGVSAMKK